MIRKKKTDLELIEEDIETIKNNVLTLSEEKINRFIERVYANVEPKAVYLLAQLLRLTEEKKKYHFQLQEKSYDHKSLQLLIIPLSITVLLAGLLYYLYIHYEVIKRDELAKLIEELKQFGVTVKQYSKSRCKGNAYFIEFIPTKKLSFYQHVIMQKLVDQAYAVHSAIYGWIKMAWIYI